MIHLHPMRAMIVEDYYLQTTDKGFERECSLLAAVVTYDSKTKVFDCDRSLEEYECRQLFDLLDDEVKWLVRSRRSMEQLH